MVGRVMSDRDTVTILLSQWYICSRLLPDTVVDIAMFDHAVCPIVANNKVVKDKNAHSV